MACLVLARSRSLDLSRRSSRRGNPSISPRLTPADALDVSVERAYDAPMSAQPKSITVDPTALKTFITRSNVDAPSGQAIDSILQNAWQILIEAQVFEVSDGSSSTPLTVEKLTMDNGNLIVTYAPGDGDTWLGAQTHANGLVEALAYTLAAILGSPPDQGKIKWPWTRN
jgi:hypothetical protein